MTRPGTPTAAERIERDTQRSLSDDDRRYSPTRVWAMEKALAASRVALVRHGYVGVGVGADGSGDPEINIIDKALK